MDKCIFNEGCDITINNRHTCRYCRFKKCLSVGMSKDLFRSPHVVHRKPTKNKQTIEKINLNKNNPFSTSTIHSLDLLCNDRSLLTVDQWSILSNITNAYDNRSATENTRHMLSSQLNFHPKMRLKTANAKAMDILRSMYVSTESFIKIIPEFSSMTTDNRTALMARNVQNLGGFNCIFMMRETNILKDVVYSSCFSSVYGPWIFNGTVKITEDIDMDGTLVKLLLVILTFSTCSDIVSFAYDKHWNR